MEHLRAVVYSRVSTDAQERDGVDDEVHADIVQLLVHYLEPAQLHAILLEMAQNLRENTRGFPDLLVWKDDTYEFVEVKSPTDHLSAQQLHWQHFFERTGVISRVLRVTWELDKEDEKTSQ